MNALLQSLRQLLRAAADARNLPYTILGVLLLLSLLSRAVLLLP